jgi:hypothetical protein
MLIRIALIVAILAGLAAAGINFVQVKQKIETEITQREFEKNAKEAAQHSLAATNKILVQVSADLKNTKAELTSTKSARDQAVAEAEDAKKRADTAAAGEAKAKADLIKTQDELATWRALGIPVEQIRATLASLKTVTAEKEAVETEKKVLVAKVNQLQSKLNEILLPDYTVELPEGLRGTVKVVDPKYDFVLLDIGLKQDVRENGQLLVNRNGRLVAKVKIQSVQTDYSIANVMPGWKLADIMEGDLVLPR